MKSTGLIKKLALTLALTTTISLATGCSNEAYENTTANLGADGKCAINYILYVVPESNLEDYYISFIGHYDTGSKYGRYKTLSYNNHKEYRVTYQVSKDEFKQLLTICGNHSMLNFSNANTTDCTFLNKIIDSYDPIEVKEFDKEDTDVNHDYTEEYEYKG